MKRSGVNQASITEHIRAHLYASLGLDAKRRGTGEDFTHILSRQFDWEFLRGMAEKMIMGWYRYGDNRDQHGERYDHISRIQKECRGYLLDGNLDRLEDIANMAMLEAIKAPINRGSLPSHRVSRVPRDRID